MSGERRSPMVALILNLALLVFLLALMVLTAALLSPRGHSLHEGTQRIATDAIASIALLGLAVTFWWERRRRNGRRASDVASEGS